MKQFSIITELPNRQKFVHHATVESDGRCTIRDYSDKIILTENSLEKAREKLLDMLERR